MTVEKLQPWLTRRWIYLRARRWIYLQLAYLFWSARHRGETFVFDARDYPYFWHPYNGTWQNERCVEVAVVAPEYLAARSAGSRILEIGNVLSHYGLRGHDVVDKYERGSGVVNEDVVHFRPRGDKYDLIVSISTLEHVGQDEMPSAPSQIWSALDNLTVNCLAAGGRMIVTLPLGYNEDLDAAVSSRRPIFAEQVYLQQVKPGGAWRQRRWEEMRKAHYDHAFGKADTVLIGFHTNPG